MFFIIKLNRLIRLSSLERLSFYKLLGDRIEGLVNAHAGTHKARRLKSLSTKDMEN